jgi:UDP-N-acetyl-D-glucosamine dehydrogenase
MSLSTAASSASKVFEEIPTGSAVDTLLKRLQDRSATVGVIGLGYVGLPIAVMSAEAFAAAIGFDVQRERAEQLNQGYSEIQDVEERAIASLIARNKILGTTDFARVRECDVIVICVPTPLNNTKDPDLSYIDSAAHHIAANLRPGQLVVLESTTYPGTTDELLLPLFEKSGLLLDHDFLLAFSPEYRLTADDSQDRRRLQRALHAGGMRVLRSAL